MGVRDRGEEAPHIISSSSSLLFYCLTRLRRMELDGEGLRLLELASRIVELPVCTGEEGTRSGIKVSSLHPIGREGALAM